MNRQSMSLKGGLNMYTGFGERHNTDESPEGRKVVYMQKNGLDHHQEHANKCFKKNDVLTVKEIYVGRSGSEVEFVEHPNQKFNTVMFADLLVGDNMSNFNPDISRITVLHPNEIVLKPNELKLSELLKLLKINNQ